MIKYISSWAEQVIICIIIVTVIEMILPKGNSKKYIKTIMGVYILYTIIFPGIKLITGKDLKVDYSDYEKYFNTIETVSEIDAPKVEDTYREQIEKKVKSDVEELGYKVGEVNVIFSMEEGIIKYVELSVSRGKKEANKVTNEIYVNKIDIGVESQTSKLEVEEINRIKQKINEDYGVAESNITINSI